MIRFNHDDFKNQELLNAYASILGINAADFKDQFAYVTEHESESDEVGQSIKQNFPETSSR